MSAKRTVKEVKEVCPKCQAPKGNWVIKQKFMGLEWHCGFCGEFIKHYR